MKSIHFNNTEQKSQPKHEIWGIPELKQFPLDNAKDVKMAETHFRFCPEQYKIQLAYNIVCRARRLNVNINNTDVLRWANAWY